MNRVRLRLSKPMINLVFGLAAVMPIYGQEVSNADGGKNASRFALIAGETPAVPRNNAGETVAVLRNNAGGTPAVPANNAGGARAVATNNTGDTTIARKDNALTTSTVLTQTTQQSANTTYVFPTPKERFHRYVKSVVGPSSLLHSAISAGLNQWRDHPEEWEQGASGYGKRYASSFGKNAIQHTVIYGLDSAMGLDTGFRRSTRTGFIPRAKDALAYAITSRTRSGKRVISVPRIAGAYTSAIVAAETWYPDRYDFKDGLRSGTRSLVTGFGLNLLREFVIKF